MNPSVALFSRQVRASWLPSGSPATQPLAQQWQAVLQRARTEADTQRLTTQLIELVSWPNLTELPPPLSGRLARLCALLWRKRTAGLLVARVLELPDEEVQPLLAALRHFGHVRVVDPGPGCEDLAAAAALRKLPPRPSCDATLLGRLWRHLTACC